MKTRKEIIKTLQDQSGAFYNQLLRIIRKREERLWRQNYQKQYVSTSQNSELYSVNTH